jgi:hypothetical protein
VRSIAPAATRSELRAFIDGDYLPVWRRFDERARAIMARRTDKESR